MKKPADCLAVLRGQEERATPLRRFLTSFCGCWYGDHTALWTFERAPEPSDIYWENMEVTSCGRVGRGSVSYFFSALVVLLTITVITAIKRRQQVY